MDPMISFQDHFSFNIEENRFFAPVDSLDHGYVFVICCFNFQNLTSGKHHVYDYPLLSLKNAESLSFCFFNVAYYTRERRPDRVASRYGVRKETFLTGVSDPCHSCAT